jgi:hypothetical protein
MPYYIYRVGMLNILAKQGEALSFKEARAFANEQRKQIGPNEKVRMIFAADELAAEELLNTQRELDPSLAGDDW